MKTQRQQQQLQHYLLLLSLTIISLFSLLDARSLNVELALAPASSPWLCSASTNNGTACSSSKLNISFPFLTSDDCHDSESSFVISNCEPSNPFPNWPSFTKNATNGSTLDSTVVNMYTPGPPRTENYITLTWSTRLLEQNTCGPFIDKEQIYQYIPHSINLQEFAHSAFVFAPSNFILLLSCNLTKAKINPQLQISSSACTAYETQCKPNRDKSYNCHQYTIPNPSKRLSLSQVMETSDCKRAMFFVAFEPSSVLLAWKPGLIQLNWNSTGTDWLASTVQKCARCIAGNGMCGYSSLHEFNCSCGPNCSYGLNTSSQSENSIKVHTIFILVGGVLATALSMLLALFALFCFCNRKKVSAEPNCKSWIKRPSFLSRKQDPALAKEISYNELVRATEAFADRNILGDGGFGAVYRGILPDGLKVAVKRLHHDNYRRIEHFSNEIKVLSNLNHPNLVKLFGFCACETERELLLVFEYASQGTVSDHLHSSLKPPMKWSLRLRIACEAADALSYLHNAVNPPIYHRDVKTANILLDDAFHVKLADFGLSKLVPLQATHISTSPQGTPGYLDPEYHECYQLTDKSDVYSLGVVLMELVSGKLAVDTSRERGEINLSTMAVMKIQCGLLEELVDPNLEMKKDPTVERSIQRVVELAFACLHGCSDDRPSMKCIAETLAYIRSEYEEPAIATEKTRFSSSPSVLFFSDSTCTSSLSSS